ncbi:phenylalanine--tRNA ligase subunit alpha [Archaeoglobus sulfaticallidus]
MLSPMEITLIKSLEEGKDYDLEQAAKISGLNKDAVLKASYLLQEKGLAEVKVVKDISYRLTDEGEKYLSEGLPEERLYSLIKQGVDSIDQAKKEMKDFGIAIGWLRKKGIAKIEGKKIVLLKDADFREKELLKKIDDGETPEGVDELIRRKLVSVDEKKEIFVRILKKPSAEIKDVIKDLTPDILISGSWKGKEFLKYDVRIPSKTIFTAKYHPYEKIVAECRKIFLEMGFTEIKGSFVQSSFWNFDALFQPQDHPARDMQDTFYLDAYEDLDDDFVEKVKRTHIDGWKTGSTGWGGDWSLDTARKLVLRTHTTAITIHYLAMNPEPPVKAFCIDRVYRRESIDATHLPEFDQLEGVLLDKDVGFRHLLGLLREFFLKMGFEDVRFRPGYFPYTEPSVEPEVYVDGLGWVELGGAGVFRKEVTEPLGIKGKVLAWGLGMGRLAMLRLGMKDLRKLYQPDLGWLREIPVSRLRW